MAINMVYQTIEIAGPDGRSVFSWNPLTALGFDVIYLPYRYTQGVRAAHSTFDWSHGNSLHYDYDGNILYSFKHIGIGKISRADGHVIWRIDRNKQKINSFSDSLLIFLQHDLQAVRDASGNITYTVLSNGDSLHPACRGLQFTVNLNDQNEPVVKLIKTITPSEEIPNTGGGGNMDMDKDGSYLMNYGLFDQDTTLLARTLFEYKDAKNKRSAVYQTSPTIFTFRAHPMNGWRPSRPVISSKGGQLSTDTKLKILKWYRLSGTDLKTVTFLGEGEKYSPQEDGFYCVASKFGLGWSVFQSIPLLQKNNPRSLPRVIAIIVLKPLRGLGPGFHLFLQLIPDLHQQLLSISWLLVQVLRHPFSWQSLIALIKRKSTNATMRKFTTICIKLP